MANALRLTANGGCEYIDNTNARTGKKYYCFIVQADTVVGTLTGGLSGSTSTDYVEGYVYINGGTSPIAVGDATGVDTYFSGAMVRSA